MLPDQKASPLFDGGEDDGVSYSERLRQAIELSGKDRNELAQALGISVQAVGQAIRGDTKTFSAENNERAARLLGVDPFWLATG